MIDETTARLAMPLLQPGQAQKELYHNEALALLDIAAQPVVEAFGLDTPPAAPALGQCWIVGPAPVGAWAGRAAALAGWTSGGWRFVAARDGLSAWSRADAQYVRFADDWRIGEIRGAAVVIDGAQVVGPRGPAIAGAVGGTTIDAEGRAAITAILDVLRGHGLIAP